MEQLKTALAENRFLNIYVPTKSDAIIAPYGFVIDGDTLVAMTD